MPRGRPPKETIPVDPKALSNQLKNLPDKINKDLLFFKPPLDIKELYKDDVCFSILDAKLLEQNGVEFAELQIELPYEGKFFCLLVGSNKLAALLVKYFQQSNEKLENVCFKFKSRTLYMEQIETNAKRR